MTHEALKELVFLSYDQELSPVDKTTVDEHLQTCAECRDAVAAWKKTAAVLFAPAPGLPERFVHKVMDRIAEEAAEKISPALRIKIFIEDLKDSLLRRRWILSGAGVLTVMALFLSHPFTVPSATHEEAMEYASDLMEGPFVYAQADEETESTPIETYFL
jgi:anti-sigma factor RsiW